MPKLKSVIAGLAITTAMTGGVVGMGSITTAYATPLHTTSFDDDGGDGIDGGDGLGLGDGEFGIGRRNFHHFHHRDRQRCNRHRGWGGGGWGGWGGWGRHNRRHNEVCVVIRNHNTNDNRAEERRREQHREHRLHENQRPW
ncbi:hypothetical protein ABZ897_40120 [Nonomuraea sp. NPDC046802]|uniref:hypothetical protein n=1 Tax=Nonomuraea sp. NPDC046802 TaxID=3154919 RepID=UPI0033C5148A